MSTQRRIWSIGLMAGPTPFRLAPVGANPILRAEDVGPEVEFVADPFMVRRAGQWQLYFEFLPRDTRIGVIGLATSADGRRFRYAGVALEEPTHLSYPQVLEHDGTLYMVPETLGLGAVRLYRATGPDRFEPVAELLAGRWADPTLFFHGRYWWLLACGAPERNDQLSLFMSDRLEGPFRPHPASPPIAGDAARARPAGRVLSWDGRLFRLAQDCVQRYGARVRAFEITRLDREHYAERELLPPILEGGRAAWNSAGMHHMDIHPLAAGGFLACVDGSEDRLIP